jgi:hypothetical protein
MQHSATFLTMTSAIFGRFLGHELAKIAARAIRRRAVPAHWIASETTQNLMAVLEWDENQFD